MTELSVSPNKSAEVCVDADLVRTNRVIFEQEALFRNRGVTCVSGACVGKAEYLADMLSTYCIASHSERPPTITLIHNNGVASDLINTIVKDLPAGKQYLVENKVMRNSTNCAINPFDTHVGFNHPTPDQSHALNLFLQKIITGKADFRDGDGLKGVAAELIKKVYDLVVSDDKATGKVYQKGCYKELDNVVSKYGVLEDSNTILASKLRDILHLKGIGVVGDDRLELWAARDQAQKQAVPVMADLLSVIEQAEREDGLIGEYLATSAVIQQAKHNIANTIASYPCFSSPTKFDVEQASVTAIDLSDVIIPGDEYNNALFFDIAHKSAIGKVFLEEHNIVFGDADSIYTEFHRDKLRLLQESYKVVVIDGFDLSPHTELLSVTARERSKCAMSYILSTETLAGLTSDGRNHRDSILMYMTRCLLFSKPTDDEVAILNRLIGEGRLGSDELKQISHQHYIYYALANANQEDDFTEIVLGKKKSMSKDERKLLHDQFTQRGLMA